MLDIQQIRTNPDMVTRASVAKKDPADIQQILNLDASRRSSLHEVEQLKSKRNAASSAIAQKKRSGQDATADITATRALGEQIKQLDEQVRELNTEIEQLMLKVPNIPHESVPRGSSEADNVVVATHGEAASLDFELKDHLQLGAELDIIDFERGAKITGSGFGVLKGAGALLERALITYMLDMHTTEHGYCEIFPPFLVNEQSLRGTGQLPKSADQMYTIGADGLFAIPTAEVPVTNLHAGEILDASQLPLSYCAYSACFRREAGSYGKDTKGFLRVHQFNKVELVRFVEPHTSYEQLELLRSHAEKVLQGLGLHYRVLQLCDADLSFAAAKCYDLEAWAPAEQKFLEVSSCSNFEDFQARRMNVRYRHEGKPRYVHTLNGSGLATSRILVALLETYQTPQGTVRIPPVLQPYMRGMKEITAA